MLARSLGWIGVGEAGGRTIEAGVVLAVLVLVVGCESPESSGETGAAERGGGGDTASSEEEAVVGRAGSFEVTMADYEAFLQRSRLFAPAEGGRPAELSKQRKAHPRVQSQTVRSMLEHHVVEREAERRGLEVDEADIEAYLRSHDKLGRFLAAPDGASGEGAMALPEGLDRADLREVARLRLLRKRLREDLLEGVTDEELWKTYRRRHDRVRIAYTEVDNSPTPDEIDAFLEETSTDKLEAYLEDHPERYRQPKLVELAIVGPEAGAEVEEGTLERAADRLAEGAAAEKVASELGLAAEAPAYLVRKENRQAFGADEGTTGHQMEGPRGAYAWRVEGWREGGTPELDRGLRREIAAEMLDDSIVASARDRLAPVLEAMRRVDRRDDGTVPEEAVEALEAEVEKAGQTLETAEIRRSNRERVSGLGLAEAVGETAFALDEASPPVVDEPVLSRGRAVALTQLERMRPDREAFERRKDEFRAEIVDEQKTIIVDDFLGRWFEEHETSKDLSPVRAKYGVLEKPQ